MSENQKCYVARSTAIAARALGDELMIMSATNSTLFTLNETAMAIWEAADGATSLEEIVSARICNRFDVGRDVAMKDAEEVVAELAGHGLLLVSPKPIAPLSKELA
jgi:coenzyme PQQ synthesis protein D (PqqD)